MRKLLFILLSVPLLSCSGNQTDSPSALNVLYVTGGGYHDYEAQMNFLTSELSERLDINWTIDYEADVGNDHKLARFDNDDWYEGFDAVIYNKCFADVTDNEYIERITRGHHDSGTAAVMLHCSMHTYRDAETIEWDRLVGLETYHHEREQREFEIEAVDRNHPVMSGFPGDSWISPQDELYIVIQTHENLVPLATAYGPETDAEHVVMWANTYGNARVVGTSAGHNNTVMEDPAYLDFLEHGLRWITE